MKKEDYLSIGMFAEKSGISRKNLIYYDTINLLKPEVVLENGYRYYNYHQLYTIQMIIALKDIGMSLEEIKAYMSERNLDKLLEVMKVQKAAAQEKIQYYYEMLQMINAQTTMLMESTHKPTGEVACVSLPKESLFFSKKVQSEGTFRFSETMSDFYRYCIEEGHRFPYPSGMLIRPKHASYEVFSDVFTAQLYAKIPVVKNFINRKITATNQYSERSKGQYLAIYFTGYQHFPVMYQRILDFAQSHDFRLDSAVYTDFVSNELIAPKFEDFLLKMLIRVID